MFCFRKVKQQPEFFFLFTIATIMIKTAAILKCDTSSIQIIKILNDWLRDDNNFLNDKNNNN